MSSSKSISRKTAVMVATGVLATALGVVGAVTRLSPQGTPVAVQTRTSSLAGADQPAAGSDTGAAGGGSGSSGTGAGTQGAAPADSTVNPGPPGGPGGSAAPASTATTGGATHSGTAHGSATTSAPRSTGHPSTSSTTPQAPAATGPAPAAPGTYHYHQVGTLPGTPSEGTLVVAPASASGAQVWTRNVGGTLPPQTTDMLFNGAGAFLLSPSDPVTGKASCTFASPVPWPLWPTTPGRSDTASASCSAPISTYQVTSTVQGTAQVTLNGATMTADVVVNTFVIKGSFNGGAINVTLTETDEYVPSLRVPVVTTSHMSGTALGIPVTTQRTDTLESSTPS